MCNESGDRELEELRALNARNVEAIDKLREMVNEMKLTLDSLSRRHADLECAPCLSPERAESLEVQERAG